MGDDGYLARVLRDAAEGRPPPEDGAVVVVPQPPGPVAGIIAFANHVVVAADVDPAWVKAQLPTGDIAAPMGARFVAALTGQLGVEPDSHDAVFAAPGTGTGAPPEGDLRLIAADRAHPRVDRSSTYRTHTTIWTTPGDDAVLIIGKGLAGRWEAAYEVEPTARNQGLGRRLVAAARDLTPAGEPLFLQVAPGNVSSLWVALAVPAFRPVAAELLFATGPGC